MFLVADFTNNNYLHLLDIICHSAYIYITTEMVIDSDLDFLFVWSYLTQNCFNYTLNTNFDSEIELIHLTTTCITGRVSYTLLYQFLLTLDGGNE